MLCVQLSALSPKRTQTYTNILRSKDLANSTQQTADPHRLVLTDVKPLAQLAVNSPACFTRQLTLQELIEIIHPQLHRSSVEHACIGTRPSRRLTAHSQSTSYSCPSDNLPSQGWTNGSTNDGLRCCSTCNMKCTMCQELNTTES